MRVPPGSEKSPSQKLINYVNKTNNQIDFSVEDSYKIGIWAPPNVNCKAMVLKHLFPAISGPYRFPDYVPVPLHYAIAYDSFKHREIMELAKLHPGKLMSYGFFSSDKPGEAKLLAKTVEAFQNKLEQVTYEEKIVIQLDKTDKTCLEQFLEIGPSYVSEDAVQGEIDCKYFFPEGYNEVEKQKVQVKKKSKKKGKKATLPPDQQINLITENEVSENATEAEIHERDESIHEEGDEEDDHESNGEEDEIEIVQTCIENDEESYLVITDKATSPMGEDHSTHTTSS